MMFNFDEKTLTGCVGLFVVVLVITVFMFIFKGKNGTFEERVAEAKTKFADNEIVQEQLQFIAEAMHSKRQVLIAE